MLKPVATDIEALKTLDERLRWLSAWTIHHANHIRENSDGLKVGGHQASCASMTAIMAALYFHALGPNDRVAVKPHAGPVLHAIHYLLGSQSRDALDAWCPPTFSPSSLSRMWLAWWIVHADSQRSRSSRIFRASMSVVRGLEHRRRIS